MIEPTGYCWKCGHPCPAGELFCNKKCDRIWRNWEAHHKKAFYLILEEFLQQYSQFSPIEDKETLLRLAITYLGSR